MSLFKNLFGRKSNELASLSIGPTDDGNEETTVIRAKPKLTVQKSMTSPVAPSLEKESKQFKSEPSADLESLFSESDKINFFLLEIIDHRWDGIQRGSRNDAVDLAVTYMSNFSFAGSTDTDENLEENTVRFFYFLQLLLMSKKPKKDFYQLQQYPPFSTQAMRSFVRLLRAYRTGGKTAVKSEFDLIYPPDEEYFRPQEPIRAIEENSGKEPDNAIVIKIIGPNSGLKSYNRAKIGIWAEYCYLCFNFGMKNEEWELELQTLGQQKGRWIDSLNVSLATGEKKRVHFDITDFRGDYSYLRD